MPSSVSRRETARKLRKPITLPKRRTNMPKKLIPTKPDLAQSSQTHERQHTYHFGGVLASCWSRVIDIETVTSVDIPGSNDPKCLLWAGSYRNALVLSSYELFSNSLGRLLTDPWQTATFAGLIVLATTASIFGGTGLSSEPLHREPVGEPEDWSTDELKKWLKERKLRFEKNATREQLIEMVKVARPANLTGTSQRAYGAV
ncbi:hypothetical protein G7K_4758-t2 [Saitoella complicata NRRL Y-17804]|uniref:Uncharacterized protein n=1 Tax=Saitoella complicata (strain BCRC 22490 / CBS 7301 / JCM 7358 / NBRC 10748 / NRRL Y-17804) TaxID=698492 RepID=A0A0E9NLB0_SAICN|nr:hypothetical protein G7K_4758-t2 [Saitoella complicata NRRL Y-17804]